MKEKNFKFKVNFAKLVKGMTDKQAGEFIKGVSDYVFYNKPLETKDEYLKGVYLYAKNELDTSERNSVNGKKGALILAEKKKRAQSVGIIVGRVVVKKTAIKGGGQIG